MTQYYVEDTWLETTPHWFNYDPAYAAATNNCVVQLDSPATDHKRSFEDALTYKCYVHGWFWVINITPGEEINIEGRFGAYHGYNATRANFSFVIGVPEIFDVRPRPDLPYLRLSFFMSTMGFSNGSYGNYVSGTVKLTDPPTVNFTPANPGVAYNKIVELQTSNAHVLFGYLDAWEADWSQWASAQKGSYVEPIVPPPPVIPMHPLICRTSVAPIIVAKPVIR